MAKQLNFEYDGQTYTLEFSRQSVKRMESKGFDINAVAQKPVTMLPMLFSGALYMHHPTVHDTLADKLYDALGGKELLLSKLSEMYSDTLNTLMEDGPENVKWTANW